MRSVSSLILSMVTYIMISTPAVASSDRLLDCIKISSHLYRITHVEYDAGHRSISFDMVQTAKDLLDDFLEIAYQKYKIDNSSIVRAMRFNEPYYFRLEDRYGVSGTIRFLANRASDCAVHFGI